MIDYSVSVAIPSIVISAIIASRALRVARPIPLKDDRLTFVRSVRWQTGDIVLFHSNPFITSFSDSEWSHVGMVVVGNSGVPRLFEITGSGKCEARAKPLLPAIISCLEKGDQSVAFRRVTPAPDARRIRRFAFRCIREKKSYDHFYWVTSFQRLFGPYFPVGANRDSVGTDSHICSSIIADALIHAGVLSGRTNTLEILPSDYSPQSSRLEWMAPYEAGPITHLRMRV